MKYTPPPSRKAGRLLVGLLAIGTVLCGLQMPAFAANATISGTVTGSEGGGLDGVTVIAYLPDVDGEPDYYDEANTDGDGKYEISVPPGEIRLCFFDYSRVHRDECLNEKPSVYSADPITVASGETTTNISPVLDKLGSLSGTVTAGVTPVEGVNVSLYEFSPDDFGGHWDYADSTSTNEAGYYVLHGEPRHYRVCFFHPYYVDECYADAAGIEDADDVAIDGTKATTGINASLVAKGTIAGRVTVAAGGSPENVWVQSYVWDAGDSTWAGNDGTSTDADGYYELPLQTGDYKVCFEDYSGAGYAPECYGDDARTPADGALVHVDNGSSTPGIDGALDLGGSITGTVYVDPGSSVDGDRSVKVVDAASGDVAGTGYVDEDGHYSVRGLLEGSYRVEFARDSGQATAAAQFYDGVQEEAGVGQATAVPVALGTSKDNVDATLVTGGTVVGHLVDGDGTDLECRLSAFTADGVLVTRSNWSNPDGTFEITGLTNGDYLVAADSGDCPDGEKFAPGGAGGAMVDQLGSAVAVAATIGGTTTLGANLVYSVMPSVAGTGVPTITGTPQVGSVLTASTGTWSVPGVSHSYTWRANGLHVGSNTSTYTPQAGDVGKRLAVTVTASKAGYNSASQSSAQTAAVVAGTPTTVAAVSVPVISGTPSVGGVLSTSPPDWSPVDATTTFQWLANGAPIAGAVGSTYSPTGAVVGKQLSLQATGAKAGYTSRVAYSSATGIVTVQPTANLSRSKKARTVTFVFTLDAAGASAAGKVKVLRGSKVLKTVSVSGNKVKVTLKQQPKGRQTYTLKYLGAGGVLPVSKKVTIKF